MSVASLNNYTVPLSTTQTKTTQGLLMPKLKYRFRAIFENFGTSTDRVEMTKQVESISRPNLNMNPFTIDVYNSKVNLVGKPSWEALTVTLRDDAGGNVTRMVGEQIQRQFDFIEQSSAASGYDYKFILKYEMLDGGNGENTPRILETWEIYGALLSTVNYGDMAYSESGPATITLNILYDNAIQTPIGQEGAGIGRLVARQIGTNVTGVR